MYNSFIKLRKLFTKKDSPFKNNTYNQIVIFSDFLEGIIMILENLHYYKKIQIPKENTQ